jgi:putative lipoic acid-binding regulatory protein
MTNKHSNSESALESNQTLMEFPCVFPLKVFGRDRERLEQVASKIICEYVCNAEITDITAKRSKTGKYTALTLTFLVEHKQQLDRIYLALSEHNAVVMTL